MKEKCKRFDPADFAAKEEARNKLFHDRQLGLFETLSDTEMVLDLTDRMPGNSVPVAAPVAGSPETPKSVAGSQKAPKLAGGGSSAAVVTKERARELRTQLKQLKDWLESECMTRDQYKFARISIDTELRSAKRK